MEFGWINVFGGCVTALMIIPNVVYAVKHRDNKNLCENRAMNLIEQIGRYACIVFMWLPLFVGKFGFAGEAGFLLYLIGNVGLLAAYWIVFFRYMKEETRLRAMILAAVPAFIFFFSGILLRHPPLIAGAVLFAVGHIYVTLQNVRSHSMKLEPVPFEMIKSGRKTIELRLYDEKRRRLRAGDTIVFTDTETGETIRKKIVRLHRFRSFEELYRNLPLLRCGYTEETVSDADPADMERYYSAEEQKKYGVVGIEMI